ncbi:MAG: pectate lyase [Veillonella sp.]|uniref:pectate lyase family protein n=1 Tax=Veillonella sp. TaxID=1926307 RepID=UPI00290490D3|nr:pectate lyase [Veillonella sp.]MDU0851859.1 pectate lyase [Veillonella sp.]MDU0925297.1 pectate lyase [Veillonella sp.]MDU1501890.1 pectate lyase [Veillonella sp.]MDU1657366.1 pectate lyase [Veillonella sp.]
MKKIMISLGLFITLIAVVMMTSFRGSAESPNFMREALPKQDGFASVGNGTTGGANATEQNVFKVTNKKEFVSALKNRKNTTPKIVLVYGTIDFDTDDNGKPLTMKDYMVDGYDFQQYLETHKPQSTAVKSLKDEQEAKRKASQKNQSKSITVHVPSNTSIIGMDNAKLKGVNLVLDSDNVIIRNIQFESPYDYFPSWDPNDGLEGNWNSQYDSISIKGGTHIWIDHSSFQDGPETVEKYFGRKYEHRDGLVDITNEADYITISYSTFENHNKTMLIGSSDSKISDEGKLHVTLHHNYFHDVVQRLPRVRFGQVHVYNNYFASDTTNGEYAYAYALGVGKKSQIYAENNVADIVGKDYTSFVKVFGGKQLTTVNNMFNGQIIDTFNDTLTPVDWKPELFNKIDPVNEVKENVLHNAGPNKIYR